MTTRQLIELSAKAVCDEIDEQFWNPLISNEDALFLAVNLKMRIDIGGGGCITIETSEICEGTVRIQEEFGADKYAALRRAIVRAAAVAFASKGQWHKQVWTVPDTMLAHNCR